MNKTTRAWKDPVYRASLGEAALAALPTSPVGVMQLSDSALDEVRGLGAAATQCIGSLGCCDGLTTNPTSCNHRSVCRPCENTMSLCASYCGGTC